MRKSLRLGIVVASVTITSCALNYDESVEVADASTARRLVVHGSISAAVEDAPTRTLTITVEREGVTTWSCDVTFPTRNPGFAPLCEADDVWYAGPGLYTFAMDDKFSTDVFVHDDAVRVQLSIDGYVGRDGPQIDYALARSYVDGNGTVALSRNERGMQIVNYGEQSIERLSMSTFVEVWRDGAWHDDHWKRAGWLCGTGWRPTMTPGKEAFMHAWFGGLEPGTYRLRAPFATNDGAPDQLATTIIDID